MTRTRLTWMILCLLGLASSVPALARGTYFTLDQIQQEVFADASSAASKALWLNAEQKQAIASVLQHPFHKARIKYWRSGERNLWVLSEIGKEKPITFAVITRAGVLERIEVMAFREVRGDEIRMPAYTAQFREQTLTTEQELANSVDGISGATYSVRSMKKVAKLALLLDRWTYAGT